MDKAVQRFSPYATSTPGGVEADMIPSDSGEWVKLEDLPDLALADQINGRLIRKLNAIHEVVTNPTEDALLHILEILDSESNLTLD